MSLSPFDYLSSINDTKEDIMVLPEDEKGYPAFMVSRGLSYFQDTVILANEMNVNHHIDNRLQYDFLRTLVRKRKRFSKWMKPQFPGDMETVKEYYGYSNQKAIAAMKNLSTEQIDDMRKTLYKGGKRKFK